MLHLHTRADHRDRRGFTLTEVIVVVAILTILLAIAIPSVIGYMTSAEMIRLNQTAKTLYLSAQDALTQAQAGGSLRQINDWSAPLPDAAAEAALSEPEYADNRGNIAYLSLTKADPHGGDADDIRQALFGSIGDKPLLENSILVEYNTKTGVVLSLLYSEKAPAFSYDSALTDRTNPIVRTEQALRAKRQGYYGVTYTGALGSQVELTAPEVMLVNSDRLYLTWTDVTPAGLTDELTYTVTLYDAKSGGELLRIENIPNLVSGGLPSMADTETISTEHLPTWAAGAALPDGEGTTHRVGQLDGRLALVLDDVHRSIFEAYPTVPVGEIYASVQPVCPGGDEAVALSNTEHAYFEAVASPVFGADTVLLANARHLNNLRYGPSDANYRQSADIDWAHPEALASPAAGAVDFQSAYFLSRDGAGATRVAGDTFTGSYDGQNRRIAGLTLAPAQDAYDADPVQVSLTSYLGVFPQIKNGQVRDLTLDGVQADFTAPDREVTLAGLIAGRAERAELSGVRVTGESRPSTLIASSLGGEAMIGGLVGDLDKSRITDCAVTATIQSGQLDSSASGLSVSQGGSQVGGIAGASKNSDLSGCASAATVYGGDELGGLVGLAHNTELTACRFEPGLVLGRDGVGGIVGRQRNGSGRVVDCQVAGALDADRQLETLFAQLAAQPAGFEAYVISAHPGDAGIIGRDRVGGVVGDNQGDVLGFETRAQVRGRGDVGGVVGYNATSAKVSWQGRSHTAAGLVAASGDHAGGVMGLAEGKNQTYDGAQNQAHVLARRYAGGIVGANGTPEGAAGGSIENCVNGGVVYAYQAYAGGIAGCNAGAIEASRSTGGQAERLQALLDLAGLPLGDYVGGVAGYNSGRIVRCQSGSLVMGGSYVGGIVGHNQGKKALIQACDTTGGVILGRGDYVGGLIGLNSTDQFSDPDAISAMGSLVSQADRVEGNRFVGGVIGCNQSSQGVLALQAVCGAQDAASRVVGEAYVGGIVGYNARSGEALDALDPYADPVSGGARGGATLLIDCRNYAQVSGARYVGGIIGLNSQSTDLTVTGALNNGAVRFDGSKSTPAQLERVARNGSYYIAGITGRNSASGVIRASANNGRIDNRSAYVGGLVEVNEGVMLACYNAGSFPAGRDHVGGIAGLNRDSGAFTPKTIDAQTYTQATIAACATTGGVIQGGSFVGGIAADNHALIRDCSFTGDGRYGTDFGIQASGDAVGGIVGYNGPEGQLVACSTSGGSIKGRNLVGGVVGYAENPTLAGLTNDSRVLGESYVGGIVGYYPGGTLTGCANETRALVAGIDGRTQGSLTVNLLRADGQADALRLNYSQMGVGGITSVSAGGPISGCLNAGAVVGAVPAGGIVGVNPEDGRLAACYNFGRVVASSQGARLATSGSFLESIARNGDYAGGIAGRNAGKLDNCYASARAGATNHVEGRWYVGGVVGLHQGGALTCQSVPVDSAECAVTGMGAVGGVAGRWEAGSVANNDKFPITATVNGDAAGRGASASAQRPASIGGVFGEVAAPVGLVNNFSFAGQVRYLSAPSDYVYAGGVLGVNPAGVSVVGCNLQGGALRINNTAEPSRNPHMGVGGIAGVNDGELLGCDVFEGASVSGGSYVGGIVGANHSDAGDNLRMITQRAPVTGTGSYVGGVVGYNTAPSALVYGAQEPLTLSGEVTVQGGDYVGGVVGASEGDLAYLINQSEVILTGKHGGGVAGAALNKGVARLSVTGCVNLGQVHAQPAASASNLGGVIGQIPAPAGGREVLVADCQNRGSVQGDRIGASCANIGGVVGEAQLGVTLDNCANTGTVTNAAPAGANVGGIVGYLNRAEAVSCANAGAVGYSHENNKSIALGGIAGRVTGGALTSCANEQGARLSVAAASGINQTAGGVGGVAGLTTRLGSASAPGADTRITDCTNAASIDLPKVPTVGGITGNSSGAALSGCRNTGDITGSTYVAGVTAMLYRTWFGVVEENTLTGCTNTGSVSGDGAAGILAAAQATETRFVLSNCQNSGPITARASGASQNGVGGILGRNYFPDGDNAILNCVNAGAVAPADGSQARNLGGIVGYSSKPLRIAQCSNSGAISRATASAGGIAGYLDSAQALVEDCVNTGEVSASSGSDLGGIVGFNRGQIAGSANRAPVTGKTRVGGIVGQHNGKGALVYGRCVNTGAVTGADSAGGLAGASVGGGVTGSYNTGAVAGVGGGGSSAVGGLIGSAEGAGGVTGSLANCYNLGPVAQGGCRYAGGVIGRRTLAYDSVGSHNIKYAFYYGFAGQPDLSVGNEPDLDRTLDEQDAPQLTEVADGQISQYRRLTDKLFADNGVTAPDWADPDSVTAQVEALLAKRVYPLSSPQDVDTQPVGGSMYAAAFTPVQGLVGGYDVYLRPQGAPDGSQDILVGATDDRLAASVRFDIDQLNLPVGATYDVVVVARGVLLPDGSGSADSPRVVLEQGRKLLPPLPNPVGDMAVGAGKQYTLSIDPAAYAASLDRALYPLLTGELYDGPYADGLAGFSLVWTDASGAPLASGQQPAYVQGEDLYRYLIDHARSSNKSQFYLQLQALSADTEGGYAPSEPVQIAYTVQQQLDAPTQPAAAFKGDSGQAAYDLSFKGVSNASGYAITLTYQAEVDGAVQTITDERRVKGSPYRLDATALNPLDGQIAFTVRALGDGAAYADSPESEACAWTLPVRLSQPTVALAADPDSDTQALVSWTSADRAEWIAKYRLTFTRSKNGGPEEPFAVSGGGNTLEVAGTVTQTTLRFAEADFGYTYRVAVSPIGVAGSALTGPEGQAAYTLYPRRPTPSALKVAQDPTDQMRHTFTWDGLDASGSPFTAAQTAGPMQLRFTRTDGAGEAITLAATAAQLKAGLTRDLGEDERFIPGQSYDVRLVALAEPDRSSASKPSANTTFILPQPLPQVTDVAAQVDGAPEPMLTYDERAHQLSWTPYSLGAEQALVKGYDVRVRLADGTDVTDQALFSPSRAQLASDPALSGVSVRLPLACAGAQVTFSVRGLSSDGSSRANAVPVAVQAVLPQAELTAPEVAALSYGAPEAAVGDGLVITLKPDAKLLAALRAIEPQLAEQATLWVRFEYAAPTAEDPGRTEAVTAALPIATGDLLSIQTLPDGGTDPDAFPAYLHAPIGEITAAVNQAMNPDAQPGYVPLTDDQVRAGIRGAGIGLAPKAGQTQFAPTPERLFTQPGAPQDYVAPEPAAWALPPEPSAITPSPSPTAGADGPTPRPSESTPRPSESSPRPSESSPRPSESSPRPSESSSQPTAPTPRPTQAAQQEDTP